MGVYLMTIQELEIMIQTCQSHCKAASDKLDELYSELAYQKMEVDRHNERMTKLVVAKKALESIAE